MGGLRCSPSPCQVLHLVCTGAGSYWSLASRDLEVMSSSPDGHLCSFARMVPRPGSGRGGSQAGAQQKPINDSKRTLRFRVVM